MDKIEELLVNKGLYDSVEISIDDFEEMEKYLSKSEYTNNTIDCYCIHCDTNRVFEFKDFETHEETEYIPICGGVGVRDHTRKPKKEELFQRYLNERYALTYYCTRDKSHSMVFDLITTDDKIIKIGQYPSVADLVKPKIAKYKSVLRNQYHEFSKAVGLFAHGIGIGSFVYLRRIIERLIFDKYSEAATKLNISQEDFEGKKFVEKIEILSDYLPPVLVANKNIYSIVSKGVHELSEEECLNMFPSIRLGIELILDDLLADKERKEKEKELAKFVAKTTGELKNK